MQTLVRIPRRFMDDHAERDLPTPKVHKSTKAHYYIDKADHAFGELLSDARHYATGVDCFPGSGMEHLAGIVSSARATKKAMESA